MVVTVNFFFRLFPFASFLEINESPTATHIFGHFLHRQRVEHDRVVDGLLRLADVDGERVRELHA